jgi:hypothetical protein
VWQFQVPRIAPQWTPEQAAQEWEIVTVLPAPGTHTAVGHWVYLRRPWPARTVVLPGEPEEAPNPVQPADDAPAPGLDAGGPE